MPSASLAPLVRFFRQQAILVPFAAIWMAYLASFAVFFPRSIHGSLVTALLLQALFAGIILVPSLFQRGEANVPRRINGIEIKVLAVLMGLSILAASALLYDRLLQGVDYSQGVCSARHQMTRLGEGRTGVSSIYSFFGLLFGYFYFAALPIVFMRKVSRPLFWTIVAVSFGLLMTQSILTASRFATMIYIVELIALAAMRWAMSDHPRIRRIDIVMSILIIVAASGFVVNEFACRANLAHQDSEQYAESFVEHLLIPAMPADELEAPDTGETNGAVKLLRHVSGLLKITTYYGIHSGFTLAAIIDTEPRPGTLSLAGPISLLPKIGIQIALPPVSDVIVGRFVSMPGSIYYDTGIAGLIGVTIAFALAFMAFRALHNRYPTNMLVTAVLTCFLVTLYLSPVTFVINVMHFPFIAFAMISTALMLDGMNRWAGRKASETP